MQGQDCAIEALQEAIREISEANIFELVSQLRDRAGR